MIVSSFFIVLFSRFQDPENFISKDVEFKTFKTLHLQTKPTIFPKINVQMSTRMAGWILLALSSYGFSGFFFLFFLTQHHLKQKRLQTVWNGTLCYHPDEEELEVD